MAGLAVGAGRNVEIAAAADPVEHALGRARADLDVPDDRLFTDHRKMLETCDGFDGAIVATDVASHASVARDCLEAGVPIYLEKPMTRTIAEAREVAAVAERTNVPVMIGFNLRYAPFYARLKKLVADGAIGQTISIEWKEVLSPQAWADGYCRASWYSRTETVGGWLLEKSCHDIDQINWLADATCLRVASFGSRKHFVPRDDVPTRCTDDCPIEPRCYFSALKFHPDGPASTPNYLPDDRWDLCVYHSGSDLMDHQVAIMEYDTGLTAAFTIVPVGNRWERVMRICGTEATIRGCDYTNEIRVLRHDGSDPVVEDPPKPEGGHGGADPRIIEAFLDFLADPSRAPRAGLRDGVESMLVAGGIELACKQGGVIDLAQFR